MLWVASAHEARETVLPLLHQSQTQGLGLFFPTPPNTFRAYDKCLTLRLASQKSWHYSLDPSRNTPLSPPTRMPMPSALSTPCGPSLSTPHSPCLFQLFTGPSQTWRP